MRSTSGPFKGLNPTVTIASKVLVIGFVIFCAVLAEQAGAIFQDVSTIILNNAKWFYLAVVSGVLAFLLYLMVSRFGHIRLGKDDERPDFNFLSWISMLFSGGMGIGLIFWSVAEPMFHYADNPFTQGMSEDSASMAMRLTFFHWGLHPWAVFVIVALALAYFSYRKDLPLTLRSILYPFIGDRIYGPIGHTVDILTVAITAFGVSQSLGLGVIQMNSGLNSVFGLHIGIGVQLGMIALIMFFAIASVMSGVGRGIRRLSEWNMVLSLIIVAVVLAIGPTRYILNTLLQSTGDYANNLIAMSLWSDANADSGWQNHWTAFYWPWWMTWAPFVGMFIARISRGRTIRELVGGALIVPTLVTLIWMSIFGGSALHEELQASETHQQAIASGALNADNEFAGGTVLQATQADTTSALFTLFDSLDPGLLGSILSILASLLLATYFITSADSGTLVLCILDSVGNPEPPQAIRVVWGIVIGCIAGALLYAGGLETIQTASIIAGLPIAVFLLVMTVGLYRTLRREPIAAAMLPPEVRPTDASLDHSSGQTTSTDETKYRSVAQAET
ncbi:choline transporter [Chromohalobacter japonicus]|uniref:Choline transporter n=1 Tax=Chromohalobacter japonicus TaxID=223900 RepID=A0A1Q8T9Y0_9GAMM|nr:BCCT family transporter [Chromohalobacter japonicus]OLO10491.1 choline transporter [Chromohalobacter japonicus]